MLSLKQFAATSALALCLSVPALAQQQSGPAADQQPAQPQQMETQPQQPDTKSMSGGTADTKDTTGTGAAATDAEKSEEMKPSTEGSGSQQAAATESTGSDLRPVTEQEPTQFLADNLIGSSVFNESDETIGRVEDLAVSEDGKIESVVVSVGGFLGLGSKQVGLPWESLEREQMDGEMVLRASTTADELNEMPEFRTMAEVKSDQEAEQARQSAAQPGTMPTTGGAGGQPQ